MQTPKGGFCPKVLCTLRGTFGKQHRKEWRLQWEQTLATSLDMADGCGDSCLGLGGALGT